MFLGKCKQTELFLICIPSRQVYEERIVSCRKTFQSHKEYYCKNPHAQKLLTLQAEKEGIESRIKACDDEITLKQKELDHLAGNKHFILSLASGGEEVFTALNTLILISY